MKKLGSRVHDPLFHARVRQIRTHRLRIEVVLRPPQLLADVARLILPDLFRPRIGLLLLRQQHGELALRHRTRRRIQIADKVGDVLPVHGHLVRRVIVGPRGIPEQGRYLIARLHHLHEQVAILRIGPIVELVVKTPPQFGVLAELQHRENVGIVGRDHDLAVSAGLMAIDVILRQPIQFSGTGDFHAPLVIGNVAFVQRHLTCKVVVELFEAGASGIVLVDASQAELQQLALHVVARGCVRLGKVQSRERLVHIAIQR